jgi:transcriptional regulator with XRE-family HTH domain
MPQKNQNRAATQVYRRQSLWQDKLMTLMRSLDEAPNSSDINIGRRLYELRIAQGLSIRGLARISGININTISHIENEKTSPNVSTLQQLASALQVPTTLFFETSIIDKEVVHQKAGLRPCTPFPHGELEDLGGGLALGKATPLLLRSKPHSNSGSEVMAHTGQEFVYCLEGSIVYWVGQDEYLLEPDDSLIFQAHLPHHWENRGDSDCRAILIICPSDENDRLVEQHLPYEKREE